jgi:uncharacterized phage protein (TIGR01671 family)
MNKEIKFRAFLEKPNFIVPVEIIDWNEQYIVHEDLNNNFHNVTSIDVPDPECVTEFKDCELMQFSGLLDKNGKEIYAEDIVQWEAKLLFEEFNSIYTGLIFYSEEDLGWKIKILTKNKEKLSHNLEIIPSKSIDDGKFELLGNRYEDPELLNDI